MAEATGVTPADGAGAGGDDMVPSDIDSPVASDAEAEEPKKKRSIRRWAARSAGRKWLISLRCCRVMLN